MNPLYQQLMNMGQSQSSMMFNNPMQKMQYIMQALTNPAAFVKNAFPDIPNEIQNNPNQILQYLQKTRGISNQQIQSLLQQYPTPNRL